MNINYNDFASAKGFDFLFEEIILPPASVASLAFIESSLYKWIVLLDKYEILYRVDRNENILSIINSRLSERASIMPFM